MTNKARASFDFEKALNELSMLVDKMERGGLDLETSLKMFEQGVNLTRQCQKKLEEAKQEVKKLVESDGKDQLVDYHNE